MPPTRGKRKRSLSRNVSHPRRRVAARNSETQEGCQIRLARDRERHTAARITETVEQHDTRLARDRQDHNAARSTETVEHHDTRLARDRQWHQRARRNPRCIGPFPARNVQSVLLGSQVVTPNNIGSLLNLDGSPVNACNQCNALLWTHETTSMCCSGGKIQLAPIRQPPDTFVQLWEGTTTEAKLFRDYSRQINNSLALSSSKVTEPPPPGSGWNPSVIIQGKLYHFVGPLRPNEGERPRFAQIYIHDPAHDEEEAMLRLGNIHLPASTTSSQRDVLLTLLQRLQSELRNCNPYVQDFVQACEIPAGEIGQCQFVINESVRPEGEHARRYNRSFKEVSVLIGDEPGRRDFVLQLRDGGLKTVSDTHRSADPLHFVLLFPHGTDGWHLGLHHTNPMTGNTIDKRMVAREFYTYHIQQRLNQSDALFQAKRLFQEYCCMAFATAENQRLYYIKNNQKKLRAELYNNLCDMIHAHDQTGTGGNPVIGQRVILPPSFAGGPRDMHRRFQDAMAIVRKYHKPDLFVTFTCNPNWQEIRDALLPMQSPSDRPDIVARVFKGKLRSYIDEIKKTHIFGKVVAHLYVVEFQKRGLPHAHILIILDNDHRLRTSDEVEKLVCAELPSDPVKFEDGSTERDQANYLQNIVLKCMLHGPCGTEKPNAPCMKNGVCEKGYPKAFTDVTTWNDNEIYPTYRRRSPQQGGRQIRYHGRTVDNRWVVPYNPYSIIRYGAHINCEVCCSTLAAKYLFKYVHKGSDRAMVSVEGTAPDAASSSRTRNEVDEYQDMRSLGSSEACWRLFSFNISERHPAVCALRVHLPDNQMVFFEEGQEHEAADSNKQITELMAFFNYNERHADTKVKYCDFPEKFTWKQNSKQWTPRKGAFNTIGRVLTVHPLAGDVYYLRMLLNHDQSKGATSYEDLRTVDGRCCETFHEACQVIGLLQDDNEWDMALTDAEATQMCPQIRELFVTLLLFSEPSDPAALFDQHHMHWWDDFMRKIPQPDDHQLLKAMVLLDIELRLQNRDKQLHDFHLPPVSNNLRERIRAMDSEMQHQQLPMVIQEELAYCHHSLQNMVDDRINGTQCLLPCQRSIYDTVMHAVRNNTPLAMFVDARGGTGKTFLLNTLLAAARTLDSEEKAISLAVASSGIAATLLLGGRTFHSRFKAPIIVTDTTSFSISKQSALSELICKANLIVWDEAPMCHRHLLEALDRTLQDLTRNTSPFGGKVVILAGDFRQVLPVVRHGSRAQIVGASLKRSSVWQHFRTSTLTENMRVRLSGEDKELKDFDDWLVQLGDGQLPYLHDDYIELPAHLCISIDSSSHEATNKSRMDVVHWVFPDLLSRHMDHKWMSERAILAPKNSAVDAINAAVSDFFVGTAITCTSADRTVNDDDATRFPTEYLNSLDTAGMPPHTLLLKEGMPLILLRNLNPKEGLCNGTRLIVQELNGRLLQAVISSGDHTGRVVFIPRIAFQPSEDTFPFQWQRRQFPVRIAFAMTINKSQGQSLQRVCLWLEEPVFTHGQLYVGASRVGHPDNIRFAIKQNGQIPTLPPNATRNVVYRDVLPPVT